jgi:SAM-dependent methyltransferase
MPRRKTPSSPVARVRKGLRHPLAGARYLRRVWRNRRIGRRVGDDHISFYRRVMASDVARKTPFGAVGTADRDDWLSLGERQFTYLRDHGLEPGHAMLEIGCGNLRAGWRFIDYLEPGAYTGVDISPEILLAAQDTLADRGLTGKRPYLMVVDDMSFKAFPDAHFDVVHAHSVFSHCPIEVVGAAFAGVSRVIKPDGVFDFTYNESGSDRYWGTLREDYFYPADMLVGLAAEHGFSAEEMTDWVHPQSKLRLRPSGD